MILRAFALLVAASLVAPAFAGDKPEGKKGPGKGGHGPDWDRLVKKLDKDGDGQISKDELAAAKAEHEKPKAEEPAKPGKKGGKHAPGAGPLAKHFDDIDKDKNGKISKDEFKAFTDALKDKKKGEKGADKPAEPKKADEPAPPKAEEPPPVK